MSTADRLWAGGILAAALVGPLLSALSVDGGLRVLAAIAFLLLTPGLALARMLELPSALAAATLCLVASLGANIVVMQIALGAGLWAPLSGQLLLAVGAITMLLVAEMRRRKAPA